MPLIHIYHTEKLTDKLKSLSQTFIKATMKELNVSESNIELIFLAAGHIEFGKDLYVEVKCKNKIDRTEEQFHNFSKQLQTILNEAGYTGTRIVILRFSPQDIAMVK